MDDCTILNGDSRELVKTIEGPIHCICTDPPYGVAFKSGSAQTAAGKRWVEEIANDDDPEIALATFLDVMRPLVEKCADEAEMYVFTAWRVLPEWMHAVASLEPFVVKNLLVWDKGTPGMGDLDGNWANSHELIIYAKKGRRVLPNRRPSIIAVNRTPSNSHIHPTEKPVALIEVLLEQSTNRGDLVVDPFSGSGATIVAAQRLGRRGIGIEMHTPFWERAIRRLDQNFFDFGES